MTDTTRSEVRGSQASRISEDAGTREPHASDPVIDAVPLLKEMPPQHIVDLAVEVSRWSPCRSKRGSVIFVGENVITHGHNYKPQGFTCDGSAECKATCRVEAIHAEQQALLAAGLTNARGAEMLHAKSVDGRLVPSGGPSCAQCSKLALAAGVAGIWLYHEDGWRWYAATEWHRLSLLATRDQLRQKDEEIARLHERLATEAADRLLKITEDTALIREIQRRLDTMQSDAPTRDAAIFDRLDYFITAESQLRAFAAEK